MITSALLGLAVLWIAVLRRYPSLFVPRRPARVVQGQHDLGENWIEVEPYPQHHEAASMPQVA
jgi:hypothetical protein